MELLNLTPHDPLVLWRDDEAVLSLPAVGQPVRCEETTSDAGVLVVDGNRVQVKTMGYGDVVGLPEPVPGVVYVVSQLILRARPDRTDLVFPIDLVRDSAGTPIGCRAFGRLAQ